jgi:hypothetical protein
MVALRLYDVALSVSEFSHLVVCFLYFRFSAVITLLSVFSPFIVELCVCRPKLGLSVKRTGVGCWLESMPCTDQLQPLELNFLLKNELYLLVEGQIEHDYDVKCIPMR